MPSLTSYAGRTTVYTGNMTTADLYYGGKNVTENSLYYSGGGTITTNVVENGCTLDCSGSLSTVTRRPATLPRPTPQAFQTGKPPM